MCARERKRPPPCVQYLGISMQLARKVGAVPMIEPERDGATRCAAAVSRRGKEASKCKLEKEEASHMTRSDGWDGTGPRIGRLRIDRSYAYSCHHRVLWSPHLTHTSFPTDRDESTPKKNFNFFTWSKKKNTNGSSRASLSLHLQHEACPILFLEPTDPCYDDDDASSQPRDQTIGGSSPPFCHVPSLSFLFFSVCSTRSSFSRFRVDSTIDSPAGGRHTFVPARQQGNHAENFQIQ